jgi:hypothetical protein
VVWHQGKAPWLSGETRKVYRMLGPMELSAMKKYMTPHSPYKKSKSLISEGPEL